MELSETFLAHFSNLEDPRIDNHNKRHNLEDVLAITILGVICGADNWVEISEFGVCKSDWLETFLSLPNGIPSHDTFSRIFSLLDPKLFEECFHSWISSLPISTEGEVIAIDGKTMRGSGHRKSGKRPLHMVSAWASNQRILLGQVATEEKSNEITAIPKLLKMIDIKGSTVTIDAMGCQQSIAKQIVAQEANYVLSLKENQPKLYADVRKILEDAKANRFRKMCYDRKREKIKAHGRIEKRVYTLLTAKDDTLFSLRWPGLKSIGIVEVTRTTNANTPAVKVERSKRYFLTTLVREDIDHFMRAVRKHWDIEINLHWSLDVSFSEDLNQSRIGNSAENLGIMRRIALNLIKQEKSGKSGVKARRKRAGWDNQYLMKVLKADQQLKSKGIDDIEN